MTSIVSYDEITSQPASVCIGARLANTILFHQITNQPASAYIGARLADIVYYYWLVKISQSHTN